MKHLDFEKPIFELEAKIAELKQVASVQNIPVDDEVHKLSEKAKRLRNDIYSKLTAWQQVQLARHPMRPYTLDYINEITEEFIELHGDRNFADDAAIVGGLAMIDDKRVMLIGHQKGRNTKENIHRNWELTMRDSPRAAIRLSEWAAMGDWRMMFVHRDWLERVTAERLECDHG